MRTIAWRMGVLGIQRRPWLEVASRGPSRTIFSIPRTRLTSGRTRRLQCHLPLNIPTPSPSPSSRTFTRPNPHATPRSSIASMASRKPPPTGSFPVPRPSHHSILFQRPQLPFQGRARGYGVRQRCPIPKCLGCCGGRVAASVQVGCVVQGGTAQASMALVGEGRSVVPCLRGGSCSSRLSALNMEPGRLGGGRVYA